MSNIYYVQSSINPNGLFADCSYFYDQAGTKPVPEGRLSIPLAAGGCEFAKTDGSELVLLGATYKTLGSPPYMTDGNFSAADEQGIVTVSMPTSRVVIKGVILLFSNPGVVDSLYASSDPEVINDN